jgi:hypothetical protein
MRCWGSVTQVLTSACFQVSQIGRRCVVNSCIRVGTSCCPYLISCESYATALCKSGEKHGKGGSAGLVNARCTACCPAVPSSLMPSGQVPRLDDIAQAHAFTDIYMPAACRPHLNALIMCSGGRGSSGLLGSRYSVSPRTAPAGSATDEGKSHSSTVMPTSLTPVHIRPTHACPAMQRWWRCPSGTPVLGSHVPS